MRALVGLYTGAEHRTLNYYGPPGSILTIPYHRLASAAAADDPTLPDLRGATVFVGFSDLYDPGQPDRFYTVYTNADGVDLSGVEIAATSFANLRERASVHMLDGNQALALAAGLGITLGLLCCMVPAWYGVPLALLAFAGYVALARALFTTHHLWLPLATPALVQLPLALVGGLTLQYLSERAKKARAEAAISRYLPAHLAHDFTEQNIDESALNSVTYSVCFASDMAGFTRIAEQLKPKELAAFLNDYFESLATPLRAHGVDVIEFRADGVMCAWTSPEPVARIRRAAAAAAIEAVAAIDAFKRRHALLAQSLRIGLECGMVYVGHAGGGGHFVYSIVGDCANTAARIEGLNKQLGTQCLASRAAIEDVPGLLLRDLGDFRFVGKTEPLPIVELMGWEAEADARLHDLSIRFNDALALLRAGLWPPAQAAFEALRRDYPDDSPTAWHLARCEREARTPGIEPAWVVTLDSK